MNSILSKCIAELEKGDPRIDYVRGMLETLLEMGSSSTVEQRIVNPKVAGPIPASPAKEGPKDEGAIMDAQARAAIERVRSLAEASVETA